MSTINVSCVDQVLTITNSPLIAAGGVNENNIVFDFCPLWDGFVKTAVFWADPDTVYNALLDDNNEAVIPAEVLDREGKIYFGVFGVSGNTRRTSEVLCYEVVKGAITSGTTPPPPTPSVYEQLLATYRTVTDDIARIDDNIDAVETNVTNLQNTLQNNKQDKTNSLTTEATLADADTFPFYDASASAHRKTTWSNIKAKLKTYLDTLYAKATHSHTKSQIMDFPTLAAVATSGNYNDLNNIPSAAAAVSIETGSYVGNGEFGDASKARTITCTKPIKHVFLVAVSNSSYSPSGAPMQISPWWFPSGAYQYCNILAGSTSMAWYLQISSDNKTLSFYTLESSYNSYVNRNGLTYQWLAICY